LHYFGGEILGATLVNWLEFISSMTAALAWPLIIAIVLLSYRKAITKILPDLRRLKAGPTGLEMEWERKLEEVREELESAEAIESVTPKDAGSQLDKPSATHPPGTESDIKNFLGEIEDLAKVSPSAAVLEAYRRLEAVLRRAVGERHPEYSLRDLSNGPRLIKIAMDDGLIREQEYSALQELRMMRNSLAHGAETQSIDYGQAMEYARLVDWLIVYIEIVGGRNRPDWQGPGAPP
jgi:hypothetical protein